LTLYLQNTFVCIWKILSLLISYFIWTCDKSCCRHTL